MNTIKITSAERRYLIRALVTLEADSQGDDEIIEINKLITRLAKLKEK